LQRRKAKLRFFATLPNDAAMLAAESFGQLDHLVRTDPAMSSIVWRSPSPAPSLTPPRARAINLAIQTFLNGTPMSPVEIDTSTVETDTIQYVATDQSTLT
jgi:hypothetical protein